MAAKDSNILIRGESGTGKELIAQSIHNASRFAEGPFVAMNCGALPRGLIESELFGYEAGAFTGASRNGSAGKFELADGGTIFLDEIGDMPLDVQAALLRVIETREIVRIGARYSKRLDVRIIAATHRNLESQICDGSFREDLYYRLNVVSIRIPPLRERKGDIVPLAEHFCRSFDVSGDVTDDCRRIPAKTAALLEAYEWSGNVRELENMIEQAMNLCGHESILPKHLPERVQMHKAPDKETYIFGDEMTGINARPTEFVSLEHTEREQIVRALRETKHNVKMSAEWLGISRRTLYRKMEKYGL
jgi:transcriptional regulator with PAS, ATPase and Fis domain